MNDRTNEHVEALLGYWRDTASPVQAEMIERGERLLTTASPLTDAEFAQYFDKLAGPEGCDFQKDGSWQCGGGLDKSRSERILRGMGFDDEKIAVVHDLVDWLGGHCDCEILFNAAERILPEEVPA